MSSKPSVDYFEKEHWGYYLLRMTAFVSQTTEVSPENWWRDVVGFMPEAQHNNIKALQRVEIYSYKTGTLTLDIQPGRIEWKYVAFKDPQQPFPNSAEDLWSNSEPLEDFLEISKRWINLNLPILRLAFGANFAKPVSDKTVGYKTLEKYLHFVRIDPDNSSDFFYQINRPRISSIYPGLVINRLSRWGIIAFMPISLDLSISTADLSMRTAPSKPILMSHLELDVNTTGESADVLAADKILSQYNELQQLAFEIASSGDIP